MKGGVPNSDLARGESEFTTPFIVGALDLRAADHASQLSIWSFPLEMLFYSTENVLQYHGWKSRLKHSLDLNG